MKTMSSKEPTRVTLEWQSDQHFLGETSRGSRLELDGRAQSAASPMETLLASLCSCMGIDIVLILEKMRARPEELSISAVGQRRDEPPRYFTSIELEIMHRGDALNQQVERAVQLSLEKYCSAAQSLRRDVDFSFRIVHLGKNAEERNETTPVR